MAGRYTFGPFQLDCLRRELWRGDQQVPLTPKALDLLTALVTSDGSAVAKDALLKRVWPDNFVSEETLTQNIATLRKALGDSAEHAQYIVTVPRYGYRFAAAVRDVSDAAKSPVSARAGNHARRATVMAAVALIAVALLVFAAGLDVFRARAPHASPAVARFEIPAPAGTVFNPSASHPAVSPDGRAIAFLASRGREESRIWVRRLDATGAHELPGTAAGFSPFWSPDSRFVAFFAKGALKKVGVSGEPVQVLCDV